MSDKGKRTVQYILMVLAVITGVTGLYTLSVWHRVLSPDLYTEAFENSNLYREVTNLIEAQVTYYLQVEGQNIIAAIIEQSSLETSEEKLIDADLLVWAINSIIENRTGNVVSRISERIGVENGIRNFTQSALTSSIGWVRGDVQAPQILASIPSVEDAQNMTETGIIRDALTGIAFNSLGFSDLPECANNTQESESLTMIVNGEWLNVTCTTNRVSAALRDQIQSTIPAQSLARIESRIQERYDLYRLNSLSQGVGEFLVNLSQLKEDLLAHRANIQAVRQVSIVLIAVSLLSMIGSYIISPKRSVKTLTYTGITIGGAMILLSLMVNQLASNRITEWLNLGRFTITSEAISTAQSMLLEQSFARSATYIVQHMHDYTVRTAVALITVSGVALLIHTFFERGGKDKIVTLIEKIDSKIRKEEKVTA